MRRRRNFDPERLLDLNRRRNLDPTRLLGFNKRRGHMRRFRRNPDPNGKPWGPSLYNPLEDKNHEFKDESHYRGEIAKLYRRNPSNICNECEMAVGTRKVRVNKEYQIWCEECIESTLDMDPNDLPLSQQHNYGRNPSRKECCCGNGKMRRWARNPRKNPTAWAPHMDAPPIENEGPATSLSTSMTEHFLGPMRHRSRRHKRMYRHRRNPSGLYNSVFARRRRRHRRYY